MCGRVRGVTSSSVDIGLVSLVLVRIGWLQISAVVATTGNLKRRSKDTGLGTGLRSRELGGTCTSSENRWRRCPLTEPSTLVHAYITTRQCSRSMRVPALYLCSMPGPVTVCGLCDPCPTQKVSGDSDILRDNTYACLPRTKVETCSAKDLPCDAKTIPISILYQFSRNGTVTNLVFGNVELNFVGLPATVTVGDSCA